MSDSEKQEKTILCIEDEPGMIDLVRLILERQGFTVLGALGAQAGIRMMHEKKPDLVLLDIMMPQMDGWAVFHYMKASEDLSDVPIVVVTARTQPIDVILARHVAKVDDYVTKPFSPKELLESIERVLSKRKES